MYRTSNTSLRTRRGPRTQQALADVDSVAAGNEGDRMPGSCQGSEATMVSSDTA